MEKKTILGIHVPDRFEQSVEVQKTLTDFGCNVKTRLGLHHSAISGCTPYGLILLELEGEPDEIAGLEAKLKAIAGIQVKKMEFDL